MLEGGKEKEIKKIIMQRPKTTALLLKMRIFM
jgi:hypothetical protein